MRLKHGLVFALICLGTISPGALAHEVANPTPVKTLPVAIAAHIPNVGAVTDRLWRGSAPSAVALKDLSDAGMKTIIDLRTTERSSSRERRISQNLGMTYVHLPMGYGTPTVDQLREFMSIVDNPLCQPVYVHCRQGADRTGTLIAIYRIARQKWPLKTAYHEMRHFHFKPWLLPLKRTVQRCDAATTVAVPGAS